MKERQAGRFSVFFVVLAVCLVYALGGGIRSNYGLMRSAIAGASGVDYAGISFVLAAAQLAFGVMQPVFGALALKTSNVFVLLGGAAMAVLGLVLTPLCRGTWALLLCFGILMPAGLGAFSFGLIMGGVTPLLGEKAGLRRVRHHQRQQRAGRHSAGTAAAGRAGPLRPVGHRHCAVPAAGMSDARPAVAAQGRRQTGGA